MVVSKIIVTHIEANINHEAKVNEALENGYTFPSKIRIQPVGEYLVTYLEKNTKPKETLPEQVKALDDEYPIIPDMPW